MTELNYGNDPIIKDQPSLNYGNDPIIKDIDPIIKDTDPNRKLRSSDLYEDRDWINASKQIYKFQNRGKDFIGTDESAAKWGLTNMRDYEWDITKTLGVAADSKHFDSKTALAWNTVFDKYEQLKGWTGSGIWGGIRHTVTDPTFLPSMFLGFGAGKIASLAGKRGAKVAVKFAVKKAVEEARKKAIKEATLNGIKGKARKELVQSAIKKATFRARSNTAMLIGTEMGAYMGADNYARQIAEMNLGRRGDQEGLNILELGLMTTGGAGLGYGLGRGLPALARLFNRSGKVAKESKIPDKIFSDKDTIEVSNIKSKVDVPISGTTKVTTRLAADAMTQNPNTRVLSYGAGQVDEATGTIKEVEELKKSGAKVDAYDLEPNMVNKERTDYRPQYNPNALYEKYDIVNASNILDNLGSTKSALNKARRIIDQVSESLTDQGILVINPSKNRNVSTMKLKHILNEKFEKVDWDKAGQAWKASNPIEKVEVKVGKDGVPIKKKSKTLLFLQKNFTSDAGAGEIIGHGQRIKRNLIKNTEKRIERHKRLLEKALKKEYGGQINARLNSKLIAGLEGRIWETKDLLPQTKEAILNMRTTVDDAQQQLIDIGAIKKGSDLELKIKSTQSTYEGPINPDNYKYYLNTSYDVFDDPKYKVSDKNKAAGKKYFIDKLSQSKSAETKAYKLAKDKEAALKDRIKEGKEIRPQDELSLRESRVIDDYETEGGFIDGLINQLSAKHGDDLTSQLNNILSSGKVGTVGQRAIKILKAKENIDTPIAGLLGETQDVGQRYANTLMKLNKLAGNFELNKAISETADRIGPKTPEQMLKSEGLPLVTRKLKGDYTEKVSDLLNEPNIEGLERPLQDLWTTQEFKDILEQGTELALPATKSALGKLYGTFLIGKVATQLSKTAYSIASVWRNFYGAGMQALANGYINPFKLAEAGHAFSQLWKMPSEEVGAKIEKMTLLGVLDSDVKAQAMIGLSKDITSDFFLSGIQKYLPKKGQRLNRKILDTYQAADNYWKWFAFLNEQGRYRQVLIDKGIDPDKVVRKFRRGGKEIGITQLDEYASKMVRENMHNYGETSRIVKLARMSPFTDFIAFKTEMFRTSKNIVKNGIKDLQEGAAIMKRGERNPDGSRKGVAQLKAGMARIGGAAGAVVSTGAVTYTTADMLGLNDLVKGTNYTKKEAIEEFNPEWDKGSDFLYFKRNGKLKKFNMSYIDPWAMFKQPIQATIRAFQTEDDPNIAFDRAADLVFGKFVDSIGPSMLPLALMDVYNNQDEYGRELSKGEGFVKDTASRLGRLWETFEPGTITTAKRIYQSITRGGYKPFGMKMNPWAEATGIIGLRYEDVNIPKVLPLKLMEPTQQLNSSDKEYRKAFRNYRGTDPEEFVDLYTRGQEQKFRAAQDIYKIIEAAKATGMSDNDIYKSITKGGFFSKNFSNQFKRALIKDGSFIPDKPENKTLIKWQYAIKDENPEAVQGLPEAREDLWTIYKQYINRPLTTYEEEPLDYGDDIIIE